MSCVHIFPAVSGCGGVAFCPLTLHWRDCLHLQAVQRADALCPHLLHSPSLWTKNKGDNVKKILLHLDLAVSDFYLTLSKC